MFRKNPRNRKRIAIPATHNPELLDLATATQLLNLPKTLGHHPQTGKEITLSIGPYGPYVKYNHHYVSIPRRTDALTFELAQALDLIQQKILSKESEIGFHPTDQSPITMISKRFQTWITHNDRKVRLPKDVDRKTVTLEQALELLSAENAHQKRPKKEGPRRKERQLRQKRPRRRRSKPRSCYRRRTPNQKRPEKEGPRRKKRQLRQKRPRILERSFHE